MELFLDFPVSNFSRLHNSCIICKYYYLAVFHNCLLVIDVKEKNKVPSTLRWGTPALTEFFGLVSVSTNNSVPLRYFRSISRVVPLKPYFSNLIIKSSWSRVFNALCESKSTKKAFLRSFPQFHFS